MSERELIRYWKDPSSRTRAASQVSPHPAGLIDLSDEELKSASGVAALIPPQTTALGCTDYTFRRWRSCCP